MYAAQRYVIVIIFININDLNVFYFRLVCTGMKQLRNVHVDESVDGGE